MVRVTLQEVKTADADRVQTAIADRIQTDLVSCLLIVVGFLIDGGQYKQPTPKLWGTVGHG